MMAEVLLKSSFWIEVAHYMNHYPKEHPNSRVHGHSYQVKLILQGKPDPQTGMLVDHEALLESQQKIQKKLDHRLLNELLGDLNPTGENLAAWIFKDLKENLFCLKAVCVSRPSIGLSIQYPASW